MNTLRGGRRGGRTEESMNKLLQFALDNPGTTSWHISPTMADSKAAYSAACIMLAEKVRRALPNRALTLNNGSTIEFIAYDVTDLFTRSMLKSPTGLMLDRVILKPEIGINAAVTFKN